MDKYTELEQGGNKIERDLKEIQKTIQFYGKIIEEIRQLLSLSENTFSTLGKESGKSNPSFYNANYSDISFLKKKN